MTPCQCHEIIRRFFSNFVHFSEYLDFKMSFIQRRDLTRSMVVCDDFEMILIAFTNLIGWNAHVSLNFYFFSELVCKFSFFKFCLKIINFFELLRNGILLPKLFWPTVRKKCSSDRKNFCNSRQKAENLQTFFSINRTIYSNSERSEQFLVSIN